MTPGRVHTLELELRLDEWPAWADRLEATFVSHIRTPDEAEIPQFHWTRPADRPSRSPATARSSSGSPFAAAARRSSC